MAWRETHGPRGGHVWENTETGEKTYHSPGQGKSSAPVPQQGGQGMPMTPPLATSPMTPPAPQAAPAEPPPDPRELLAKKLQETDDPKAYLRILGAAMMQTEGDAKKAFKLAEAAMTSQLAVSFKVPQWIKLLCDDSIHILVIGETNSGKTTVAQAIAAESHGKLFIIDPVFEPGNWGGMPVVTVSPDGDYEPIRLAVLALIEEMKRRIGLHQVGGEIGERILIIADEVPNTVLEVKEMGVFIRRMAQWGRHADMHLIGISQSDRVGSLGLEGFGDVQSNFSTVYLGEKAIERDERLAGREHAGILNFRGKDRVIDIAGCVGLATKPIDPKRALQLPGVMTVGGGPKPAPTTGNETHNYDTDEPGKGAAAQYQREPAADPFLLGMAQAFLAGGDAMVQRYQREAPSGAGAEFEAELRKAME